MILHLLGVNGPYPASHGATSGYLLEVENHLFQFDLGSGVLSRLTALTAPESISALFVSHWHYDHIADIPVLMYRLQAAESVLSVYGPEDAGSPVHNLVRSVSCFSFHPVSAGMSINIGNELIRVCDARHPVPAVGYTVSSGGKRFGYTGDTNTLPSLSEDYRGCDLLLADGLFPRDAWSEAKPHLSAELAAGLANESGAGSLIITHLNPDFSPQLLLQESRTVFPPVRVAEAGSRIDI